ncbi:MAG: hypothetical protein JWO94_802 [Verrucomicrobiaceae bacterium]|nr:hypothetical protein [Verrucomicrobiaceae bacterium]
MIYKTSIDRGSFCRVIALALMPSFRLILCALAASFLLPATGKCDGQEDAFKQLLHPANAAELEAAVVAAKAAGLARQTILEARLIFGIQTEDTVLISKLIPDLEEVALDFKPHNSPGGLRSVEQFRGLTCYARAMKAADDKDEDELRAQVAEGLWKFPQQASLFGALIVKFQLNERMSHLTVDFGMPLMTSGGESTTLSDLLGTQKALMLEFWSAQGEEKLSSLPGMIKRAGYLKALGIAPAGVNIDAKDGDIVAEKVRLQNKIMFPWLAEQKERSITRLLDVASLPRVVLISQQGRILFNGSPEDPGFGKALRRIVPSMPGLAK